MNQSEVLTCVYDKQQLQEEVKRQHRKVNNIKHGVDVRNTDFDWR